MLNKMKTIFTFQRIKYESQRNASSIFDHVSLTHIGSY